MYLKYSLVATSMSVRGGGEKTVDRKEYRPFTATFSADGMSEINDPIFQQVLPIGPISICKTYQYQITGTLIPSRSELSGLRVLRGLGCLSAV